MLPISANQHELPLTCQAGYRPTGNFICGLETLYSGRFKEPYPTCEFAPCFTPPPITGAYNIGSLRSPCNDSSVEEFPHGTRCEYTCATGYAPAPPGADPHFVCEQGEWKRSLDSTCEPLSQTTTQ